MRYRVLGPLEVEHAGQIVPLRGPRRRSLLGALLVHANEAVPDEALLEALWGDHPPESGQAALRVRISQLRKAVGGAIARTPAGYSLRVEAGELDAARFEELLAEGRRLRENDPQQACELLTEALALWRGPAYADVAAEPFARAEAARLDELRLAATEARVGADLALGRHAELVPELEALVADSPLRERLRGLLMLALYRSGRQAAALRVYRDGRDELVDELGLEPGQGLRDLQAAILRQEPELLGAAAEPPPDERKLVTIVAVLAPSAPAAAAAAASLEAAGARIETSERDLLVASFGAPVAQEDHAERALRTALALTGRSTDVRVGVASGEIVVGGGTGKSAAGTALAVATRLARAAAPGTILTSERTVAGARRAFEFGEQGHHPGTPLLRELPPGRPTSAFVGRARELEQLLAAYADAVAARAPRMVTLVGNAGVGKSRLAAELWGRLGADAAAPRLRSGRCIAHGRGLTYRPLADVLRQELGLLETDSAEVIAARLEGRETLGLTLGLDAPPELHPLTARERLQTAWVELLAELAAAGPVVVVLEDLHWAREPLLDLLERVLDEVTGSLLLVCTARPELEETRPSWGRRRDAVSIWLEPLAPGEARELIAASRLDVPAPVHDVLIERAEGNPFFLEELAASIADGAAAATGVPDTVQAVLAARIDQLPPEQKAALQAAAVTGRIFWLGAVAALLGGPEPDVALLEARDFVRRRPTSALAGEREFAFKHALTRDVAYGSLSDARRAELHEAFAFWLEESGGGRDEHAALLAHHYAEAAQRDGMRERAIVWLRRAAQLAIGRYDLDEALALLARAIELGPEASVELGLWRLVGRANALRHDGEPFLAAMMRALELSDDDETAAELYADLSFETAIRAGMWRKRPERELVDGWIDRALELARPQSASRARALIARCVWAPVGTAAAAREASAIAEALGDVELRSYALDARGITAWVAGERDLGRAFEERRFELLDRIHDPDHVADIHYAPVSGCVWHGRFQEARRLARCHDELTRGLTAHHRVHGVAVLVEVEELTGDWERIRVELEPRAESTILTNLETPCVRSPRSLMVMAVAEHVLGDDQRSRRFEELADAFGMEGYGHVLETPRLRLALLRGDLGTAERLSSEPLPDRGWHRGWMLLSTESVRLDALAALGRRAEIEAWPRERPHTYLEPFWLRALGTVREDGELLELALRRFQALRLDWHAEQTRVTLGV